MATTDEHFEDPHDEVAFRAHTATQEIPVVRVDDLEPPAHPTAHTRIPREIMVLVAAAFVIAVGFSIVTPVLPQYAQSFNVGVTAASTLVSAFALMRLAFAPAGGSLVNRLGERPMYIAGLLITAASTLAAALAQNFTQLLIFRSLGGIGSVLFTVSAMALLVRLSPPAARGRASSLYGSAFLLGSVLGPSLGSALAVYGYRVPFFAYAVALLIASAVVAVFLAGARLREPGPQQSKPALTVRDAWRDRAYRSVLLSAFAHGWTNMGSRMALIPLFVTALATTTPGVQESLVGVVLTVFAAGNAAGLLCASRLIDSLGRQPLMVAGFAISAVGILPMGFLADPVLLMGLSVIGGMGAGLLAPAMQVVVADVIGHGRSGGQALSTFQMSQDVGVILGPMITGAIAATWGYQWAFALSGAVLLLGMVAALLGRETLPSEARAAQRG